VYRWLILQGVHFEKNT